MVKFYHIVGFVCLITMSKVTSLELKMSFLV